MGLAWVVLTTALALATLPASRGQRDLGFRCPERSDCSCDPTHFEVICDRRGFPMTIRVITGNNSYVEVDCGTNTLPRELSEIPRMSIGMSSIQTFGFKGCPLPDVPIADVAARLGVSSTVALSFQSFSRSNNMSAYPFNHFFRGMENLSKLVLSMGGLTELPVDLFSGMQNLTWLNLRFNKVRLNIEVFKPLKNLKILELSANELRAIPDGFFSDMKYLVRLALWQNKLVELQPEVFRGLDSLQTLDLSNNELQTLPSDVFSSLPNLTELSLLANNFSSLPGDLFKNNKKLYHLRIYHNKQQLKALPENLLSNLGDLSDVNLYSCGIETLPESLLWNSTAIRKIALNNNNLTTLPDSLFRDQVNLQNLDLSNNQIKSLQDNIFVSLSSLEILNLDNNELNIIPGYLLANTTNLKEISIQNNKIKQIAQNAFDTLSQVTIINLKNNKLESLMRHMPSDNFASFGATSVFSEVMTHLEILNLSHNYITEIYSDWILSKNLTELDLSYNRITRIEFADLMVISEKIFIDLRYNNITEINFKQVNTFPIPEEKRPRDAYHSRSKDPQNVKVYLDGNPIDCDCILYDFILFIHNKHDPEIRSLMNIEADKAECASPEDLRGKLVTRVQPRELVCSLDSPQTSHPKCPQHCRCGYRTFDKALIVNCSMSLNNKIPKLPDINEIGGINGIELYLEGNQITNLVTYATNLTTDHVKKLFLSDNNITDLNLAYISPMIEILDLRNNKMAYINDSIVEKLRNLTNLQQLFFSGNPIACDCKNYHFLQFLQEKFKKVSDFDQIKCPDGVKVANVSPASLCGPPPAIIAASVLVALAGLIIGILAALYYKYNQEIKVYLFSKGLFLPWITEKEIDKHKLYDAFISYSHKDEDFVVNKLVAELEKGPHPFKFCLHFRDWVAGDWISSQIARSVEDSRRTLVVLSPNFLDSEWGKMEFRAAHSKALKEGRARVIVILYGNIGSLDNLDAELQAYLSTNTYIKWGDPWFWDKLRYALPHPPHHHHGQSCHPGKKVGLDDRLELINPSGPTTPAAQNTPPSHQAHTNPLIEHVSPAANGLVPKAAGLTNGTITMNGLRVNGNAKHSEV